MSFQEAGVLGIKTAEGTVVPILDFRTQRWNQTVFTTIADQQRQALFEFYYRGQGAAQWIYLDSLPLERIPPAKAGEPDLSVEATVDERGNMAVALSDPAGRKTFSFVLKAEALAAILPAAHPAGPAQAQTGKSRRRSRGGRVLALLFGAVLIALAVIFFWDRFLTVPAKGASSTRKTQPSAPIQDQAQDVKPKAPAPAEKAPESATGAPKAASSGPAPLEPQGGEESGILSVQGGPSANEEGRYQIRWGDTLWRISERFYGERGLFEELAEANQLADPDYIIAGREIYLPPAVQGSRRSGPGTGDTGR